MIDRRASCVGSILAIAMLTSSLAAAPQPTPPAVAPSSTPSRASALAYVAGEISRALGPVPKGALVVVSPLASDITATKADELSLRLATLVAGRVAGARAHPQPATLAVARGQAGHAASLVFVQVEVVKGELRVTGDLYPIVANGWERLRNPAPAPGAHAFANAPIDAEVRSFLTPILLQHAKLTKTKHDEGEVLAAGCGDVDGDGGLEIVLASRTRVSIGKIRGGKFAPQRTVPWSSLASRVPVPLREPLAAIVVAPREHKGEVLLGTSDRGGVATDATLVARRQLGGLPLAGASGDGCVLTNPSASALEGRIIACTMPGKGDPAAILSLPSASIDAVAWANAVDKDGNATALVATRDVGGTLRVSRVDDLGATESPSLASVGAQIALGDLDLDGIPEVVTSSDASDDAITIHSLNKAAKDGVTERLRFPAKEGVRAIALCPPEDRGVPAVVAVVGSEVWLVR